MDKQDVTSENALALLLELSINMYEAYKNEIPKNKECHERISLGKDEVNHINDSEIRIYQDVMEFWITYGRYHERYFKFYPEGKYERKPEVVLDGDTANTGMVESFENNDPWKEYHFKMINHIKKQTDHILAGLEKGSKRNVKLDEFRQSQKGKSIKDLPSSKGIEVIKK
jgi:hypothetical protein